MSARSFAFIRRTLPLLNPIKLKSLTYRSCSFVLWLCQYLLQCCVIVVKTCALARRGQGAWLVDDWYYSQLEEKPLCTSLGMTEVWVTIIAFPMATVSYEVCPRIGRVCLLPSSLSPPEHPNNARALGSFPFDRHHGGAERHEALSCP